jgi:uncharacterized membrane protein
MVVMGASPLFGPSGHAPPLHANPAALRAAPLIQRTPFAATRARPGVVATAATASNAAPPPVAQVTSVIMPANTSAAPAPVDSSGGGGGGGSTDASAAPQASAPTSAAAPVGASSDASTTHGLPWALPAAIAVGVAGLAIGGYFLLRKKKR